MKRTILTLWIAILLSPISFSQNEEGNGNSKKSYIEKGQIDLGMRTTTSLFGRDNLPGLGVGGQTRIQIFDFLNTEWYADWISIDLNGAGTRNNAHIGWSVLFYPFKKGRVIPYAIAGHCFDFAKVIPRSTPFNDRSDEIITRWSSAVQMGLGSHFYISDKFDISLNAQYMLHLGNHLEYDLQNTNGEYYLDTQNHTDAGPGIEGHILITASLNYRIVDLW